MAPRKRKGEGEEVQVKTKATSVRVTRSSTRRVNSNSTELPQPVLPKKKAKTKATTKEAEKENVEDKTGGDDSKKMSIVIEHCKQCQSFKTRAIQVKNGLENGVPGITVILNPEKPRRGCFEIRVEGGEKFISLLDMTRPFVPMKKLDMDKVISDIIDKMK